MWCFSHLNLGSSCCLFVSKDDGWNVSRERRPGEVFRPRHNHRCSLIQTRLPNEVLVFFFQNISSASPQNRKRVHQCVESLDTQTPYITFSRFHSSSRVGHFPIDVFCRILWRDSFIWFHVYTRWVHDLGEGGICFYFWIASLSICSVSIPFFVKQKTGILHTILNVFSNTFISHAGRKGCTLQLKFRTLAKERRCHP